MVATRTQDQGSADVHGAVLVARRDGPPPSEATDLGNIIPFTRTRRHSEAAIFPLPSIDASERPALHAAKIWIGVSIACFAASLALHSLLLVMFWQEPRPMPSIGVEVMTVDIVIGATAAAGAAPSPGEQEAQVATPSEQPAQEEPIAEQQSRVATVLPQEVPVAAQETAPEAKPQETPAEAQAVDPTLQEQTETAVAEVTATTQPTERTEQPRPQVQAVQKAPERKRIEAPTEKKASQKKQANAQRANPANNVGIGRSDRSIDQYKSLVAAHLQRHKQYPSGARGAGMATVSFSLDGNGRVTSARLAGSSGNSAFDQEVVAMARRASPFPRHPEGKANNFTVSVRFQMP